MGLVFGFYHMPHLCIPMRSNLLSANSVKKGTFYLSRDFLEVAVKLIQSHAANKEISMGPHRLCFDRGRLFLLRRELKLPETPCEIRLGQFDYGPWHVHVEEVENCQKGSVTNWKDAWKGGCEICLPEGKYHLGPALLSAPYSGNTPISKWWTNAKVPAFFRHLLPVVWDENQICAEFLTGRKNESQKKGIKGLKIGFHSSPLSQ